MALSFPLSLTDFYGKLDVADSPFELPSSLETSGETGSGEVLSADVGTRLWMGTVSLTVCDLVEGEDINATLEALGQAGRTFFIFNSRRAYPKMDPKGAILGAAAPKLKTVAANNRDVTLKDLPAGYVLSKGDHFGFQYGANPVRYANHRVLVGGTANGAGEVTIETTSFVRSGWALNAPVSLIKAPVKAQLVPKSHKVGTANRNKITGISFSWTQVLR